MALRADKRHPLKPQVTESQTITSQSRLEQPRHIGQLLTCIRSQRGISQKTIAAELGASGSANINRFEKTGASLGKKRIEGYIQLLAQPVIQGQTYRDPLTPSQIEILQRMPWTHAEIKQTTERALHYDLADCATPHAPPQLRFLLRMLVESRQPAFICDGLFFIHAFNGACLNLFSLDPYNGYLQQWEAWHSFASKIMANSPVRRAHISPDQYFPPMVDLFFQISAEFSFTPQLTCLLDCMNRLGGAERTRFPQWWNSAQTFRLHYDLSLLKRTIRYRGRTLYVYNPIPHIEHVATPAGPLPYYFVMWEADQADKQNSVEDLPGLAPPGEIFFAADYDAKQNFHVNCWQNYQQ